MGDRLRKRKSQFPPEFGRRLENRSRFRGNLTDEEVRHGRSDIKGVDRKLRRRGEKRKGRDYKIGR
jgi:hypothetical protein